MKADIYPYEWYPVLTINFSIPENNEYDIPHTLVLRYNNAMSEFKAVQKELGEIREAFQEVGK